MLLEGEPKHLMARSAAILHCIVGNVRCFWVSWIDLSPYRVKGEWCWWTTPLMPCWCPSCYAAWQEVLLLRVFFRSKSQTIHQVSNEPPGPTRWLPEQERTVCACGVVKHHETFKRSHLVVSLLNKTVIHVYFSLFVLQLEQIQKHTWYL